MNDFFKRLAEVLEVDDTLTRETAIADLPWDSLSALSVLAMVSSDYGVTLSPTDLQEVKTAGDIEDLVKRQS